MKFPIALTLHFTLAPQQSQWKQVHSEELVELCPYLHKYWSSGIFRGTGSTTGKQRSAESQPGIFLRGHSKCLLQGVQTLDRLCGLDDTPLIKARCLPRCFEMQWPEVAVCREHALSMQLGAARIVLSALCITAFWEIFHLCNSLCVVKYYGNNNSYYYYCYWHYYYYYYY